MEIEFDVRHTATALMAVAHDRAEIRVGAITIAATIDDRTRFMSVHCATVVTELVREHHDVPVLAVVAHQRRRKRSTKIRADGVVVVRTHRVEPSNAAPESATRKQMREIARDCVHIERPVIAELRQLH